MLTYSISDLLRGDIGEIFGIVQHRGEEITITRFGKPIVRIVPITSVTHADKSLTDPSANRSSMSLDKLTSMPVPPDAIPPRKRK